ncbi:MAG: MbnP family protein [Bacteroidota bacterium]
MKNTIIMISMLASVFMTACTKEKETTTGDPLMTANINLSFNNTINGNAINMGQIAYKNTANNMYSVTTLKYYITNVSLVDENNKEWFAKNYNLIDLEQPSQNTFALTDVPKAKYKTIKFIVGVDSTRNTSGVQDGFLDPSYGMIWTWNTGYIFFKHEGNFTNSSSNTQALRFHLGTNAGRTFVEFPLPLVDVNGTTNKLTINFDLNKVYEGIGNNIDFNVDNDRQSVDAGDSFWIMNMRANLPRAFTFGKVE